jgi:hypothetical protein
MKRILLIAACFVPAACTDHERDARIAAARPAD